MFQLEPHHLSSKRGFCKTAKVSRNKDCHHLVLGKESINFCQLWNSLTTGDNWGEMENLKNLLLESDLTQLKSCLTSGSIFFAWDSVNTWKNRSKLSPSSSLSTRPKTGQLKMSKLSSFCQVLSQRNCVIASVT